MRLQGAGPAAESGRGGGAGLGQRPAAERRVGVGWRVLLPERGRLTIDPGQWAAARASGRRVGAVPYSGAQREERRERAPPESSQVEARRAGRRALGPPRAPDARGPLCAGRAPGPAMRAAPRSDRRRRPRRGESARRARCQSTINAGLRPVARSPLACRSASAHGLDSTPVRPPPTRPRAQRGGAPLTGEPRLRDEPRCEWPRAAQGAGSAASEPLVARPRGRLGPQPPGLTSVGSLTALAWVERGSCERRCPRVPRAEVLRGCLRSLKLRASSDSGTK